MFSSDKTGFHQLYMYDPTSFEIRKISVPEFEDADLGSAAHSSLAKYYHLSHCWCKANVRPVAHLLS